MERFKKVLNPLVILLGVIIILIVKLEQSKQEIMKLEEREIVIINGHYYVEVGPYGKFLVTREQYEAVKVGDPIPEYLKKRGK